MQLHPTIQMGFFFFFEEKNLIQKNSNFPSKGGNRQMRSQAHITCWKCREKGHDQNE